jgi:hypothetical protein
LEYWSAGVLEFFNLGFWITDCGLVYNNDHVSEFPTLVKSEFRIPKSEIKATPVLQYSTTPVNIDKALTLSLQLFEIDYEKAFFILATSTPVAAGCLLQQEIQEKQSYAYHPESIGRKQLLQFPLRQNQR